MRWLRHVLLGGLCLLPVACGAAPPDDEDQFADDVGTVTSALGSCASACGQVLPDCSCAVSCTSQGNCCADYTQACPTCNTPARSWTSPTELEAATSTYPLYPLETNPQVGIAANGDATVVWRFKPQEPPFTISTRRRQFLGSAWNSKTTFAGTGASPSIAVGTAGHAFVTFGTEERTYSPTTGWATASLATTPTLAAVDAFGSQMLLYQSATDLRARRFTSAGVLESSFTMSDDVGWFDLASNDTNKFGAVYSKGSMLILARYTSSGWGGTDFATSGTYPRVGMDHAGNLLVAWISGNSIKALRVIGTSVGPAVTVATYSQTPIDLRLAVNSSGRAIATWKRPVGSNMNISAATFDPAGGWSSSALVTTATPSPISGGTRPGYQDVGIDDCGAGQLVYETYPYTGYVVRYTPAAGWSASPTLLSVNSLQNPRLATAANGVSTIVWDGEKVNVKAVRYQ